MKSDYRPIIILGDPRIGKTTLVRNILRRIFMRGWAKPKNTVVIAKENEYKTLGVKKVYPVLRKRDVLRDNTVIVLEDLPRLARKRALRIIEELLTQTAHYRSYVIVTSQSDSFETSFLKRFKVLVFLRAGLNVGKWCAAFGRVGRFLSRRAANLENYRYILWDRESGFIINERENRDAEAVVEGLRKVLRKGRRIETVIEEQESREGGYNNNHFQETKKGRIEALALSGKGVSEIIRETGYDPYYVRVIVSNLRRKGFNIPKEKVEAEVVAV
ncbi:MAG: AAA family ATPase [Candidatus Jordarchaeales archaeon]